PVPQRARGAARAVQALRRAGASGCGGSARGGGTMTKLDDLIERARGTGVDRAAAGRYVRDLVHRMESRPIVGETIGNYHIVRQIGEGGMGAVYLGTHSILGRPAAIKVVHPELSRNRDIVRWFFNEA